MQPILRAIYSDLGDPSAVRRKGKLSRNIARILRILSPSDFFSNMQGYDDMREDFEVVYLYPLIKELHAFTWPSASSLLSE